VGTASVSLPVDSGGSNTEDPFEAKPPPMQPSRSALSPSTGNPTVAGPSVPSSASPGAFSPARGNPKGKGVVVTVLVAVIVVLTLVLTGVIPLPSGGSSGPVRPTSFVAADATADSLAADIQGGPWSLIFVSAMDVTTAYSYLIGSNCPFISGSGSDSTSSYTGSYSNGLLADWLFAYLDPSTTQTLFVAVNGGEAFFLAIASNTVSCGQHGPLPPSYVPATVEDTTQVATTLLGSLQTQRFLANETSANASYMLINLGGGAGWVWDVSYETCSLAGMVPPVGSEVQAIVNATSGKIVELSSAAAGPGCARHPGSSSIGSEFFTGYPGLSICPAGETYAADGCQGGDYTYSLNIEDAQSQVTFGRVLFGAEMANGTSINLGPAEGGFAVLNGTGSLLAESAPSHHLSMAAWSFPIGSPATSVTPLTGTEEILIDVGTADPEGNGYQFVATGQGQLTGSWAIDLP
jgi:hypothetical protein